MDRDFFLEGGRILVPREEDHEWTDSLCCLWAAPPDMVSAFSLRALYSSRMDGEKFSNIENLFQRTLGILDASLDDLVTELDQLRDEDIRKVPHIRAIYDYLDKSKTPLSDLRYAQCWFLVNKIVNVRLTQGQSCV